MTIDPETLAAYADGELDAVNAKRVEHAIAADPGLAAQVDAHRVLKAKLTAHFAPVADAPMPDRLTALLTRDSNVINLVEARAARKASRPPNRWTRWAAGGAMAASLIVAVGIGLHGDPELGDPVYASGALDRALSTQLASADAVDGQRILLSFRNKGGTLCRGYASGRQAGIACRRGARWIIERTARASAAGSSEYRQAGATEAEILATAQDMASGPALDSTQEKAARDTGWPVVTR